MIGPNKAIPEQRADISSKSPKKIHENLLSTGDRKTQKDSFIG